MRTVCRLAAAAALLLAPVPVQADDGPIVAAQALWEQAFATGDGARAAEMAFTEDARLLPDGAPIVEGRDAIADYWQQAFDAGFRDLELGLVAVDMVGDDTMIETGTWSVTVPTEGGGAATAGGKALVVWKKQADGVWRMAQDMWNMDAPPGP
ncbi:SgcJ/EcaC family oxidoreductase [Amaricoccus sp.]|uniref:YybH family protein n=1 Tax=Amaricoccus sp. TaxID=1872485 RepID=UPI00260420AA|nr:SgcJ/EcaC family oxidoreductase [Amaricoccus sp.]HRO11632.1 SgcJ/EcaC family oxidoreductase [Amaricoccus sp.]